MGLDSSPWRGARLLEDADKAGDKVLVRLRAARHHLVQRAQRGVHHGRVLQWHTFWTSTKQVLKETARRQLTGCSSGALR